MFDFFKDEIIPRVGIESFSRCQDELEILPMVLITNEDSKALVSGQSDKGKINAEYMATAHSTDVLYLMVEFERDSGSKRIFLIVRKLRGNFLISIIPSP